MANKQRIVGLDLAKSVAIFLVILIHYSFYTGFIHNSPLGNLATTFTTVGVPLFFMVNGYLLFKSHFSANKHLHKIVNMIIVLLVWKIISLPIVSFLNHSAIDWKSVPSYFLGGSYTAAPLGYFWFINALISIYILFPMLKYAYDNNQYRRYLAIFTTVIGVLIFGVTVGNNVCSIISTSTGHAIPDIFTSLSQYNPLGSYGYAFVYFIIGGYASDIAMWLDRHSNSHVATKNIVLITLALLDWALLFALQRYQARTKHIAFYVENGYQSLSVLVLTLLLFQLFLQIKQLPNGIQRCVTIAGSNTLGIYYLHLILIYILRDTVHHFNLFTDASLPSNLLLVLLLFVTATAISVLGRKIPVLKRLFIG